MVNRSFVASRRTRHPSDGNDPGVDRTRSVLMLAREHLGGRNLVAGLVVGAYLVPQAMAYGELAGVGASAGLTVALIPLLLYPLLGRTRWLSLGPSRRSPSWPQPRSGRSPRASTCPCRSCSASSAS